MYNSTFLIPKNEINHKYKSCMCPFSIYVANLTNMGISKRAVTPT